jgi:hypothetical protein
MDIPTNEQIVQSIEDFLARHDMAATRFGRDATNNQNIVSDLRGGHAPSLAVLRRLKAFMERTDAEKAAADHVQGSTGDPAVSSSGKADAISAPQVSA